jgi:hypothetical protein
VAASSKAIFINLICSVDLGVYSKVYNVLNKSGV